METKFGLATTLNRSITGMSLHDTYLTFVGAVDTIGVGGRC